MCQGASVPKLLYASAVHIMQAARHKKNAAAAARLTEWG